MAINIPAKMTSAWLATLSDDELRELEKQLVANFPRDESYYSNKIAYRTILTRHDRVCEEMIRRRLPDPIDRELITLPFQVPSTFSPNGRRWIIDLTDKELAWVKEKVCFAARHAMLLAEWLNRNGKRDTAHHQKVSNTAYHMYLSKKFILIEECKRQKKANRQKRNARLSLSNQTEHICDFPINGKKRPYTQGCPRCEEIKKQELAKRESRLSMTWANIGMEAAQKVGQLADQEAIEWAVAGGLAMHLYGGPRLTKNVDIIASGPLLLTPQRQLSFGGSSYTLQVGRYEVQIDWIVRTDDYQKYYRAALKDGIKLPNGLRLVTFEDYLLIAVGGLLPTNGLRLVTPEWLVILKINAGRQKDLDDIVFLLKLQKLVDRSTIKQKVVETAGEDAWLAMLPDFRRLCDMADDNTKI